MYFIADSVTNVFQTFFVHATPTPGPLPVVRQQVKKCPWKITLLMETSISMTLSKNQKKIDIYKIQCDIVVLLLYRSSGHLA